MRKQQQNYIRIGAIIFVVFFGYVIFSADKGTLLPFIQKLYAFPFGDKVGHLLLVAVLTIASNIIVNRRVAVTGRTLSVGTLAVFVLISFEEVSQALFSTRTFDLLDLMFSYIGILLGVGTLRFFSQRRTVAASSEAD